jgi:uncharacterized protein YceH (UPF0502 family)
MSFCSGIKADGGRCKAQAISGTEWCFNHHPDYEEQRRRRGSRGGKRGGRGRPVVELAAIKGKLESLADDVLSGSVDRSDAAVVAQIYNTVIRAVATGLKVKEAEEIEVRLEELEALLAQREAG